MRKLNYLDLKRGRCFIDIDDIFHREHTTLNIRELISYLDQYMPQVKEEAWESIFICSRRSDIFDCEKLSESLGCLLSQSLIL